MKVTTVLLAILGFSYGRPQFEPQLQAQQQFQQAAPIYITRYVNDYQDNNNYYYLYEQSDGQRKEETGEFRNLGPQPEDQILGVRGSYSYQGPDGVTYSVSYTADENGFQPEGDHIPPSAGVKPKLGISSAAIASLAG